MYLCISTKKYPRIHIYDNFSKIYDKKFPNHNYFFIRSNYVEACLLCSCPFSPFSLSWLLPTPILMGTDWEDRVLPSLMDCL